MAQRSISARYEDGSLKLQSKLPLPNHAKVRVIFDWPTSTARRTRGLLRVPRRLVRLVVDSDEFSTLNT